MLWCQGAPYGAAGWARRNTPVFAGGSRQARGSRVLGPWPTSCLRVPVAWLRSGRGGEPRGALARLVGWPVPVSGAGAATSGVQGGALRGLSPHPLFGLLVCCGSPGPRVRGVLSLWQPTGR